MAEHGNVIPLRPQEENSPPEGAEILSSAQMGSQLRWSQLYDAAKKEPTLLELIPADILSRLRAADPDAKPRLVPPPEG